jgi:hypothetical protein
MTKRVERVLRAVTGAVLVCAPSGASAQSPDMNFFVAVEGASWGADQPALEVSDTQCTDLAYAQGYGHLTWHAYLNGTAADGEADQRARERIGQGPWYNYYGVSIAEDLAQLHSDENNPWVELAVTVLGDYPPDGALQLPWGSRLDADLYTRAGPYLCFGVPG